MDMGLSGKRALVTGSSAGLGRGDRGVAGRRRCVGSGARRDVERAEGRCRWHSHGRRSSPPPVVFLASVHAGHLSGADIRVDGGTIRSVV